MIVFVVFIYIYLRLDLIALAVRSAHLDWGRKLGILSPPATVYPGAVSLTGNILLY